jgi:hypothetical protein
MKTKNGIVNLDVDAITLRGTGKLGYSESSRMHSTLQRLSETLSDEVRVPSKKKHTVTCPKCKQEFKTNNPNKIPQHKPGWRARWSGTSTDEGGFCTQKKDWREPHEIIETGKEIYINGDLIKKGDHVAFSTYPNYVSFQGREELKEHVIKDVYLMDNKQFHLGLEGIDETVPCHYFVKNFIKL